MNSGGNITREFELTPNLEDFIASRAHAILEGSCYTVTLSFHEEYLKALRGHVSEKDCTFCTKTHTLKGEEFCAEIENKLAQAWDVDYSFRIELTTSQSTPPSVSARRFSLGPAADLSRPR